MSKSAARRQVVCYPNYRYFKMFIGYSHTQHLNRSDSAVRMIEDFFDTHFSEFQQNKFIEHFDQMTPEEKRFPGRIKDYE